MCCRPSVVLLLFIIPCMVTFYVLSFMIRRRVWPSFTRSWICTDRTWSGPTDPGKPPAPTGTPPSSWPGSTTTGALCYIQTIRYCCNRLHIVSISFLNLYQSQHFDPLILILNHKATNCKLIIYKIKISILHCVYFSMLMLGRKSIWYQKINILNKI